MFLSTSNNFYKFNNTYLEASLVKVIYIIILNTIFSFSISNKLKLRANNLKIFLLYFLTVFYLIKSYFKLV